MGEVRLQKEKLRDITHKKITASDHLQKVVSQAFLADAAISESETSQDGAKALQAFASAAMSKLKQSIEKSKAYIEKYAATKKSFRKSAYKLLLWHKKVVAKALQDSVTIQHESLSLESEFATSVFNIQRKLMKQAATKYRVLKAREKLMLKLAKFYENKAQTLKNSVIKNTEVAKAEKIASGGATLAEFQDASAKAQGSTKIDSKLKRETAIIAIMDAAQQTAKAKRAELNKKHKTALELATRFTTAAQAVNAKFPVAVARLRQGTINAKKAKSYAQKV